MHTSTSPSSPPTSLHPTPPQVFPWGCQNNTVILFYAFGWRVLSKYPLQVMWYSWARHRVLPDYKRVTSLRKEQLIIDHYGLLSLSIIPQTPGTIMLWRTVGRINVLQISGPLHISSRTTIHQYIQPSIRNAPQSKIDEKTNVSTRPVTVVQMFRMHLCSLIQNVHLFWNVTLI